MKIFVMRDLDLGQIAVMTVLARGEEFRWVSAGRDAVCFPHLPALNEPSEWGHYHEAVADRNGGGLTLFFSLQNITGECCRDGDPQIIYRWSAFEAGMIATSIQILYPETVPDVKEIELQLANKDDKGLSLWSRGVCDNFGNMDARVHGVRPDTHKLLVKSCTTLNTGPRQVQFAPHRYVEVRLLES